MTFRQPSKYYIRVMEYNDALGGSHLKAEFEIPNTGLVGVLSVDKAKGGLGSNLGWI